MTAATPSCQDGSRGMRRSLASAENGGRGAGRPASAVVIGATSTGRPASGHDLARELAPAAGAAAGHVVDAWAEAAGQRLDDGGGEMAGVGRRADLVVDDAQRLHGAKRRRRRARAPPPGSS